MENIAKRIKYSAELLNDFIFDWNANTRELYIPVEWKNLIGYSDGEIENSLTGLMQTVDETNKDESLCNLEKLIKGEIVIAKSTKKIRCKDGSIKWFSVAAKVVEWNTDGPPARIIAVYTNITEKKVAEQAYEMEHRISEAMLNACKDDFFFIDRDMHIISANNTFLATMKTNFKKDIRFGDGLFDLEFASETLKQKWLEVCTKALAGETISFNNYFFNTPTQIERWSENSLNPVWVNNEVVGVAIRSKEIRKPQLQDEISDEQQLRLFESVIMNTQDAVIISEAEPINLPGPRILYVNEAFLKITGYTKEEVIGKTPRILQGEKTDRKELDKLRKALESWQPCEIELINYKKNGEEFWVNLSITPLANENGWFTHWVSIQKDITKQKKDEEKFKMEQKLLRTVIDNIPGSIYVKDLQGRKIIANPLDIKFMGLQSEEEALGKTDMEVYGKDISENFNKIDEIVLKTGKPILNYEEKLSLNNSKEIKWLLTSKVPLRNEQNEIVGLVGFGNDITERKQMMEKIFANEERLQKIITASTDIIWEIDLNSTIIFCSGQVEAIVGYTPDEVIGKTLDFFLVPNEKEIRLQHYRELQETNQTIKDFEFWVNHKNGSLICISTNSFPKIDQQGNLIGYIGTHKDITLRKKTELEIIKSQRFYKLISELNDKILNAKNEVDLYSEICEVFVQTGGFIFVWIGIPSERSNSIRPIVWEGNGSGFLEEIGKLTFLDIAEGRGPGGNALREGRYFYSNDIANDAAMLPWREQALTRGFHAAIVLPLKIGKNITALLNIYAAEPFFFNREEINLLERLSENISFALTAFHINDQKTAAEIQLKKVSQAVEQTSTTVVITDCNGVVEYVNTAFTNTTGYSLEEIKGQTQKLIQSGETPDELYRQLWNNLSAGMKWSGEIKNKRKNGQVFWEYVVISPIVNAQGIITNYVSVKEDITLRKKAEQKLLETNQHLKLKTDELSNTNLELERFAYIASHDLQEPLRMITNFLQLFEKKYQDIVDETGKKYIHFAVDGALRMKELIKDLLQYSRAGSGSLEITDVEMNAVMKDVLLLFRNEVYQTNVSIAINDLPVIKAGRTAMIHLMQNLISNAIKFKGALDPKIEISSEETEQDWIISVKDNGIGIDPEFSEKIFIVFQRLHRKDEYDGTGIGLSICKKIVERYKGKIWVESRLGEGACFKFSIPKM